MAMFLPSAMPCEGHKYLTRSHFARLRTFSPTPPPSGDGLLGTCRALQSLLSVSPVPSPRRSQSRRLQSPFHIPAAPPARLSQKVLKPEPKPSPPPRGVNKRTRKTYEDEDGDVDMATREARDRFSTPKRQKRAPSELPLGLAIADFESLEESVTQTRTDRITPQPDDQPILPSIELPQEGESSDWTAEDDQKLIEIVLEKLKLSKRDWEECARRIGKDNASVGKRWRALVGEGNIGLRRGRRMVRGRLDECWR
jgi:hypothetical protein